MVETRDVTWEVELPEQAGVEELEDAPEAGGTDDVDSAPTTPLPVLGKGIPHQLRAVSPKTQADDDF